MANGYVCPECGFDYDTVSPADAVVAAKSFPRRFREALADHDEEVLRARPDPATWSAVEYTAHVADVLEWLAGCVHAIVVQDHPTLGADDPDALARDRSYNEQPLDDVLEHLGRSSSALAEAIDAVAPDDWARTGTFPWGERDALTMARNAIHEGVHHLRDVERVLRAVTSSAP